MLAHDIIVIGASAGGVQALSELTALLPADLPAAILVVLHLPAEGPRALPAILNRAGSLPASWAQNEEPITPGRIYLAPPDHHMLVQPGHICLARGPRKNRHRPAIDPLFCTAARIYGPRVAGVLLSGMLDDGTAGLLAIKLRRGVTIVQDPDEALHNSMPLNGIQHVEVDHVLPISAMATVLTRLARDPVADIEPASDLLDADLANQIGACYLTGLEATGLPELPLDFSCPECGGTLEELTLGSLLRYQCPVGHVYSMDTLRVSQFEALEPALWSVQRTLREQTSLARQSAMHEHDSVRLLAAARAEDRGRRAEKHAALLEELLDGQGNRVHPAPAADAGERSEIPAVNYGGRGDNNHA